jgi:hypothetical protein
MGEVKQQSHLPLRARSFLLGQGFCKDARHVAIFRASAVYASSFVAAVTPIQSSGGGWNSNRMVAHRCAPQQSPDKGMEGFVSSLFETEKNHDIF